MVSAEIDVSTSWSDLPLVASHAQHLQAAAISPAVAREARVWSLIDAEACPEAFAWWAQRGAVPGMVFTYKSPTKGPVLQLRPDTPVTTDDGQARKYLFPKGTGAVLGEVVANPDSDTLLIVEGTKQALAAASCLQDVSIYGMAGAWNWQADGVPSNDLSVVEGKRVIIALDADAAENLDVYNGGAGLKQAVLALGADSAAFIQLPGRHKVGLDDVLAAMPAHQRGGFLLRLIDQAKPKPADKAPKRSTSTGNGGRYFDDAGLKAATLASDVLQTGPLAEGLDDLMWAFDGGVWKPAKHVVRTRCVAKLGERFRPFHVAAVEPIVRTMTPNLACDPIPEIINFRNGMLIWKTGELIPHTPEILTTVQLAVDYNPEATCPAFERFLGEVVPADMVPVVWELIGYLMYSGNPLHKAVMLTGHGRNGKGTLLRTIIRMLGKHNVTSVSLHDLLNTRFRTAELFGKLANIAGDIDGTYIESTATLKSITGEDQVQAERKGRDPFDFTPWAVPVFSANKVPPSADATVGYLSRWLIVNFPNSFAGREDRTLDERLTTPSELEGIAAKAVRHLVTLLERGRFDESSTSAQEARREFVRRVDHVQTWLDDCTEVDREHWEPRSHLYQSYQRWCFEEGVRFPLKATDFYDRLLSPANTTHPVQVAKRRGARGFRGLRVVEGDQPAGPGPGNDSRVKTREVTPPSDPEERNTQNTTKQPASGTNGKSPDNSCPPVETPVGSGDPGIEGAEGAAGAPYPRAYAREEGGVASRARVRAVPEAAPLPPLAPYSSVTSEVTRFHIVTRDPDAEPTPLTIADALSVVMHELRAAGALTVDVETSGFPVGHRHHELRTVQLGSAHRAVVIDVRDGDGAQPARGLVREMLRLAPRLHAHSATADLVPLAAAGLCDAEEAWTRMHDTVIPAKLIDPALTGSDPGLKRLSATLLDEATSGAADEARKALFRSNRWLTNVKVTSPVERSGWAQVDPADPVMLRYAASDVLDTAAIAAKLLPTNSIDGYLDAFEGATLSPVLLERERAVQRVTARIAHRGMRVDPEAVERLRAQHLPAAEAAAAQIQALGIDNPNSDRQIAEHLVMLDVPLPATTKGNPSVAGDVLERFAQLDGEAGQLVRAVLTHREHTKVLGTFIEPYRQAVRHGDGRVYPTIYTLQADTGRMSAVRPNLQQVPREGGIRAMLTADPGHLLISADFSGVELRVAAALSGDTNLRRMLAEGEDLHWLIARQVWGPDATKANRYIAKRIVFGRLYGGGVATLARQAGTDEATVQRAIHQLDAMTPGLSHWSMRWRDAVRNGHTEFETRQGRVIHLDRAHPHKAPNYLIQGSARELFVDALLAWDRTPFGGGVVLPVHDEIVAVVPEAQAAAATRALVQAMSTELEGVEIVAEASEPSFAWQDAS